MCLITSQVYLLSGPLLAADNVLFSLLALCRYRTFEPMYYPEMELLLTWPYWQWPLAVHSVHAVALLKQSK